MQTPTFRSENEVMKYTEISVMNGEGLFNHNPSLFTLTEYFEWLINRSEKMKSKLIVEFNKRTLVLDDKEYEIEPAVAKWIIHNTDIRVNYKGKE